MNRSNQRKREILAFARKHGDAAAVDAFKVGARTLRHWRKQAREDPLGEAVLGDRRHANSGRPRGRKVCRQHAAFIRAYRADPLHLNAGKQVIKPELDAFCRRHNLPCLSVSTIGRVIAGARDGMRAAPRADLDRRGKVKPRKPRKNSDRRIPKNFNPRNPGDLLALDTVEVRPVGGGKPFFFFTAIDHCSRMGFAAAFPRRNAACAAAFLSALMVVMPVRALLTDNGAEFQADFDRLAKQQGLRRLFIFPGCPAQNGRNERFNRTLRHGFAQAHEHLADDLPLLNRQLSRWLLWYNAKKPHRALNGKTPLNSLQQSAGNGKVLWAPTPPARKTC